MPSITTRVKPLMKSPSKKRNMSRNVDPHPYSRPDRKSDDGVRAKKIRPRRNDHEKNGLPNVRPIGKKPSA